MPRDDSPLDRIPAPDALKDRMTAWRTAHPTATFAEMEVEATHQVAALRAELIAVALEAGEPQAPPACPDCDTPMHRVGDHERTLTTSGPEQITVRGGRYRCSACGAELFPPR